MQLELDELQRDALREVLESYLAELHIEIAHTDSAEFKGGLKARRDVLAGILSAVRRPVSRARGRPR